MESINNKKGQEIKKTCSLNKTYYYEYDDDVVDGHGDGNEITTESTVYIITKI